MNGIIPEYNLNINNKRKISVPYVYFIQGKTRRVIMTARHETHNVITSRNTVYLSVAKGKFNCLSKRKGVINILILIQKLIKIMRVYDWLLVSMLSRYWLSLIYYYRNNSLHVTTLTFHSQEIMVSATFLTKFQNSIIYYVYICTYI